MRHKNLLLTLIPAYFVTRHSKGISMATIYAIIVLNAMLGGVPK